MITRFYADENRAITEGCGCCSNDLNIIRDREQVLRELSKNILIAVNICELVKYSFSDLLKITLEKGELK